MSITNTVFIPPFRRFEMNDNQCADAADRVARFAAELEVSGSGKTR